MVVQFQHHKRRKEIAQLLEKHPKETIYLAWDKVSTHEDDEAEEVVRAAAGRLVLLYLPMFSSWLNPIEMLWRHFRRESPTVNCLRRSRHCWQRPKISLTVTTSARRKSCQPSAPLPKKVV